MADIEDRLNFNYFTYMLHGIGILLPWNMFMIANSYFMNYKLTDTPYQYTYLNFVTFFSQIPNVSFNWLNIFVKILGGDLSKRIFWSLALNIVLFVVTIVLAMMDTSSWKIGFFWFTMVKVIFLNAATGVYQNTIFGMAAPLPFKFTQVILLGNNLSGVFSILMKLIFDRITTNVRISATYFFLSSIIVLCLCLLSYFAFPINAYFRHHTVEQMKAVEPKKKDEEEERPPYWEIFKRASIHCFNVGISFFITLAIFPAIQVNVSSPSNFMGDSFVDITCFLTFNLTATIGSIIPRFFVWPKPKHLWIPCVVRLIMIPLFFFCNYNLPEKERLLSVWFGDWIYWILAIILGLTSGYLTTVAMIYCATTAEPKYAGIAGQFGAACLITGIFIGIIVTFAWPYILLKDAPKE